MMKAEPPQVSSSLLRHSTKSCRLPSTYGRPWNHAAAHRTHFVNVQHALGSWRTAMFQSVQRKTLSLTHSLQHDAY